MPKRLRGLSARARGIFGSMRFTVIITYLAVIIVTLVLMCIYVIGLLTDNLYNNEKVDMFAKANIIAMTISDQWAEDAKLSELRFGDVVERSLAGTSIRGVVTNTAYTVLYDTNKESVMVGKAFMRDVIKKGIDGEQAEAIRSENGMKLLTVAVPVEKNGAVIGGVYLAKTVNGIDDTIRVISTSLTMFSAMIVILIGLLSFGLSLIITRPLAEFTYAAREISKGNFNYRLKVKGTNEMAQMAATLNYMCDELSLLEEKRRKFVSDASHELKTPMAGVKLICDSLVQTPDADPETIREFLGDVSEEVDRLTRIVDRLLVLTKLDGGNVALKLGEADIKALLDNVTRKLRSVAAAKGIRLERLYSDAEIGPVVMDYDKIYEAVYNITENAVKYTPDGGRVSVDLQERDGYAVIRVEDTGAGIPEEERERVFERFYRLDDSRSRETGGTGLGLAISKEAVAMHGGRIEISDGADGGSVFIIILPMYRGKE
ncbi:MAG: HAMP domain-containing sensor histidine kinase [Clostridia bacterium]|nr:HAMP domain-containing sensor histidine kinase [Clostridia bacterium]